MAITKDSIAYAPIAGEHSNRIVAACVAPWGAASAVKALGQTYSIRLEVGSAQRWDGLKTSIQCDRQYGTLMAAANVDHSWDPCAIVRSDMSEAYGTKYAELWVAAPYSDGPIRARLRIPCRFTMAAQCAAEWAPLQTITAHLDAPWASVTHVEAQHASRYSILNRNLVAGSRTQVWNLSDILNVFIDSNESAVRAFHNGVFI